MGYARRLAAQRRHRNPFYLMRSAVDETRSRWCRRRRYLTKPLHSPNAARFEPRTAFVTEEASPHYTSAISCGSLAHKGPCGERSCFAPRIPPAQ